MAAATHFIGATPRSRPRGRKGGVADHAKATAGMPTITCPSGVIACNFRRTASRSTPARDSASGVDVTSVKTTPALAAAARRSRSQAPARQTGHVPLYRTSIGRIIAPSWAVATPSQSDLTPRGWLSALHPHDGAASQQRTLALPSPSTDIQMLLFAERGLRCWLSACSRNGEFAPATGRLRSLTRRRAGRTIIATLHCTPSLVG